MSSEAIYTCKVDGCGNESITGSNGYCECHKDIYEYVEKIEEFMDAGGLWDAYQEYHNGELFD